MAEDDVERRRWLTPASDAFVRLDLIGESASFREALRLINRIAAVDATVLLQGETGTGKELAARALHYLSSRRELPFIPVNCGALPDTLLASEMFGHERGAFTDAKQSSPGLVAQAEGGTLFLDEIEAMTPQAQVVVLRFLQDHTYRRLGSNRVSHGNVRIIASSNVDLNELVQRGEFRADLLFRLSVLSVTMPPLRERGNDALVLSEHFLSRFALQYHRARRRLHSDTAAWLPQYDWPGNVRELENLILREFLLAEGDVISITPLGQALSEAGRELGGPQQAFKSAKARAVAEFERSYLRNLLTHTCGNISLAARISRKDRSALNKLVKKHGLDSESFRNLPR
jgi:DNA-binding NtrC family response regulator